MLDFCLADRVWYSNLWRCGQCVLWYARSTATVQEILGVHEACPCSFTHTSFWRSCHGGCLCHRRAVCTVSYYSTRWVWDPSQGIVRGSVQEDGFLFARNILSYIPKVGVNSDGHNLCSVYCGRLKTFSHTPERYVSRTAWPEWKELLPIFTNEHNATTWDRLSLIHQKSAETIP